MKIFIANPTKTIVRSTDHDYVHKYFVRMNTYQDIDFYTNESLLTRLHRDSVYVKNRIIDKLKGSSKNLNKNPYNDVFYVKAPLDCDLIFSYGGFPMQILSSVQKPIICEQTYAYGGRMDFKEWKEYLVKSRKFYVERSDLLVTPSIESLHCFQQVFPQYAYKIRVIPYFLPYLEAIEGEKLKSKFSSMDKIRLLFVGKEAKRKGLDKLVEAFEQLPPSVQDKFEVTVVSKFIDGNVALPKSFIYKSFVENIIHEFQKAHALVFLTKQEAYGLVLVEAMASGCAILTTDHPIQKSILNNTGGWFVNPLDVDAIRQILLDMTNISQEVFVKLAIANINNYLTDKSADQVSKKYFEMFSTLID